MASNLVYLVVSLLLISPLIVVATVTYDQRSFIINGQRKILISGSIHYPRSTPEMWPDLIKKAKEGGLDVIDTYVFWNGHEPTQGQYYFEDRYDLVRFIKVVKEAGLYVNLRIGPYICAEWNFGGFPVWLKYIPGISFRTDNEPFKAEMEKFTSKIVSMMKEEKLYEPQGGPIILSQIENEYGTYYDEPSGKSYVSWVIKMAVGLDTQVPWIMSKQEYAPDPIIDACNGYYCENFYPIRKNTPKIFLEVWTGGATGFGQPNQHRPVEDMAFAVLRFVMKSGSLFNYYMYHGGTNFGRTGGALLTTNYDFDAPIDEYGLLRNKKWGHLRDLHKAIKQCEHSLVSADAVITSLGKNLESSVFKSNSSCAAFLANFDSESSLRVKFNGLPYDLPAWSVSILPDCKTVAFNSAKVTAQEGEGKMVSIGGFSWNSYKESTNELTNNTFTKNWLVDQLNMTWDKTDYLWYTTFVDIEESENFIKSRKYPTLNVTSAGHALHVFINGNYTAMTGASDGNIEKPRLTYTSNANLVAGRNKIFILSVAQGLPNVGHHYETWNLGVIGPITLSGLNEGTRDLSKQEWTYQVGLHGESLDVYTDNGSSKIKWDGIAKNQPLIWYKATFTAPKGNEPLALDMKSMSKGQIWINRQIVDRYWSSYIAKGSCNGCDYRGTFDWNKCLYDCGGPTQRWYHVPRSWLKPTNNLLVVLEELGGDPSGITLVKRVQALI